MTRDRLRSPEIARDRPRVSVIFPLFFAAAAVAQGFAGVVPAALMPAWVMSLMAATQASVTRTPLATVFMLGLSAAASAQLSVLLPTVIIASYVGVWASPVAGPLHRHILPVQEAGLSWPSSVPHATACALMDSGDVQPYK